MSLAIVEHTHTAHTHTHTQHPLTYTHIDTHLTFYITAVFVERSRVWKALRLLNRLTMSLNSTCDCVCMCVFLCIFVCVCVCVCVCVRGGWGQRVRCPRVI